MTKQNATTDRILEFFRILILNDKLRTDYDKFFSGLNFIENLVTNNKEEGYIEYYEYYTTVEDGILKRKYFEDQFVPKLNTEKEKSREWFIKQIEELPNNEDKLLYHERFKNELSFLIKQSKGKNLLISQYENVTNALISLYDEIIDYPITLDSNIINPSENFQYKLEWAKDPELFFLLVASLIESKHLTIHNGKNSQTNIATALYSQFHVNQKNKNKEFKPSSFNQRCKPSNQIYLDSKLGDQKDKITKLLNDIIKEIN